MAKKLLEIMRDKIEIEQFLTNLATGKKLYKS